MIKNIFVTLEIIEDKSRRKKKKRGQVACVLYIRSFSVGPNLKVDEAFDFDFDFHSVGGYYQTFHVKKTTHCFFYSSDTSLPC